MHVTSLPTDILCLILQNLSVPELGKLACTDHFFKSLVDEYGWPGYLRANCRPSHSLATARSSWSPQSCAYFDALTDASWSKAEFIARPLSRPWRGRLQPILTVNSSRLFVAAGHTIYSYRFGATCDERQSPQVMAEGSCIFPPPSNAHRDITSFTTGGSDDSHNTLYIGFQDGSIERATVMESSEGETSPFALFRSPVARGDDLIESLSASGNSLLSLSSNGHVALSSMDSSLSSSIQLNARSWVCHLCLHAADRYAAFGTHSITPLTVHSIAEDGLRPNPTAILQPKLSSLPMSSSAVYGISQAPPSAPWGSSSRILVSGWFDGCVRCYDLRSSSRLGDSEQSSSSQIPLRPVLKLHDPLSYEAIYSVSCGGGYSSYIAAGTARHSVVTFWDIRAPKKGWSVHAPGNDNSPVYSVILESSRLFGATQSRPFVYDFGPGVTPNTYPNLPYDGALKYKKDRYSPGFYVTTYRHDTPINR